MAGKYDRHRQQRQIRSEQRLFAAALFTGVFGASSRGEAYCGDLIKQINDLVWSFPARVTSAATLARDFAADSLQMQQTAGNRDNLWLHTQQGAA